MISARLPSLAKLAQIAALAPVRPVGWTDRTEAVKSLTNPVSNMAASGDWSGPFETTDLPVDHALMLQPGRCSLFVADIGAATDWFLAQNLGPEQDESVSDIYTCHNWTVPSTGDHQFSFHEFDSTHEHPNGVRWAMLDYTIPQTRQPEVPQ